MRRNSEVPSLIPQSGAYFSVRLLINYDNLDFSVESYNFTDLLYMQMILSFMS